VRADTQVGFDLTIAPKLPVPIPVVGATNTITYEVANIGTGAFRGGQQTFNGVLRGAVNLIPFPMTVSCGTPSNQTIQANVSKHRCSDQVSPVAYSSSSGEPVYAGLPFGCTSATPCGRSTFIASCTAALVACNLRAQTKAVCFDFHVTLDKPCLINNRCCVCV
jgi:hypothetical protein